MARRIEKFREEGVTELQAAAQRVTHTASALFRSGTKASAP